MWCLSIGRRRRTRQHNGAVTPTARPTVVLAKDGFCSAGKGSSIMSHLPEASTADALSVTFLFSDPSPAVEVSATYALGLRRAPGRLRKGDRLMEMLLDGSRSGYVRAGRVLPAFGAATHEEPVMEPRARPGKRSREGRGCQCTIFRRRPGPAVAAANRVPDRSVGSCRSKPRSPGAGRPPACFLESPSADVLHGRTISPLVN